MSDSFANSTTISGSSQVLIDSPCTYRGFSLKETSGSASASLVLWDSNVGASGPILEEVTLASAGSAREPYSTGVVAHHGVYVQVVSGALAGTVRTS